MAELAERQHGVIAAWQLDGVGVGDDVRRRWLESERLFRQQRHVYSLTPRVQPRGRMLKDGFPVTKVARTLIDLAAVLPLGRLRDSFERAERLRLLDAKEVSEQMHGKRGAKKIRTILAEWSEPEPTKNEFEQALRNLCREYDLPLPSQNVTLLGYEVDALWSAERLVVELDGWQWHKTRRAFEEDRRRAADLEAAGYRVLRFTWRQMRDDKATVAAAIKSGCPRAAGRDRAPARAEVRRPSAL